MIQPRQNGLVLNKSFANKTSVSRMPLTGQSVNLATTPQPVAVEETDEQIDARIKERFDILKDLTRCAINGDIRSLIVSGPPGLSKSYTVEQELTQADESQYDIIKGYARATGVYRALYNYRERGKTLSFDDADSIWQDENSLNLLKNACDTTELRRISWRAETRMRDDEEEPMPTSFMYDGSIIFITNYDFHDMIHSNHKYSEHMSAMLSRSHYIDLSLKTKRDYIIRIKQVMREGMLCELPESQRTEIIAFITEHKDVLLELSLRMAIKISHLMRTHPANWERVAKITCCR